ncbi:MAG: hypothetical protein IKR67_04590 [Lachnospiraceae bacterium]|nr:hypothetical protein [Lachnospiraceae bacterium]
MKRIMLRSVYDAFDYVMAHYAPFGMEEMAEKQDTYAVISIQDTHTGGFGFEFRPNKYCQGALTLYFDDIIKEVPGAVMFSEDQARQIIDFVEANKSAETLLIHCYGGESRSRAVAAFVTKMLGADNSKYFETGHPNHIVYDTLIKVWTKK